MKAVAAALLSALCAFGVAATVRSQAEFPSGSAPRDLTVAATLKAGTAEPDSRSAQMEVAVKLTGIAKVGQGDAVLLETTHPGGGVQRPMLGVGDRTDGIEVISINPKAATASLKQGGKVTEYSIGAGERSEMAPTVNLKDADSRQVLDLYQKLSGRTVLRSPALPAARVNVQSDDGPVGAVARALSDSGIVVTPRSDRFAFATTKRDVPSRLQIQDPPLPREVPKAERFPTGLISFNEADRAQVLDIYQELTGRTLVVSPSLPQAKITFRSETELTRDEAIWLTESALHLAGIAATRPFDKFAFATALSDTQRMAQLEAPPAPANNVERFPPGLVKFVSAELDQVLDIYQELAGRSVVKSPALPPSKITLKSQTPLTRDEAVWLIESALYLGGIQCVPAGDKQVKVIRDPGADANHN